MFARKTRAVVWAFCTLLFVSLFFAMIVALIFDMADIHWFYFVFVVIILGAVWIGSPEDPDEKEDRVNKRRRT